MWGPVLYQAHSGSPSVCGVQCSIKLIQARVQCSTKLIQAHHQCVGSSALSSSFRLAISVWGPVLYQAHSGSPSVCGVQCSIKLIQARHQCVGSSALLSSFRLAISVWSLVLYQAHSGLGPVLYQTHSGSPSVCGVQCSIKLIQASHQCVGSSALSSSFRLAISV